MADTQWDFEVADTLRGFSVFSSVILDKEKLPLRAVTKLTLLDDAGLIKTEVVSSGLRVTLTEDGKRALWHWDMAHKNCQLHFPEK